METAEAMDTKEVAGDTAEEGNVETYKTSDGTVVKLKNADAEEDGE